MKDSAGSGLLRRFWLPSAAGVKSKIIINDKWANSSSSHTYSCHHASQMKWVCSGSWAFPIFLHIFPFSHCKRNLSYSHLRALLWAFYVRFTKLACNLAFFFFFFPRYFKAFGGFGRAKLFSVLLIFRNESNRYVYVFSELSFSLMIVYLITV